MLLINNVRIIAIGINRSIDSSLSRNILSIAGSSNHAVAPVERAIIPVLPGKETFPYVLRVVSEVLSSNGSTSMGSVCGSTPWPRLKM